MGPIKDTNWTCHCHRPQDSTGLLLPVAVSHCHRPWRFYHLQGRIRKSSSSRGFKALYALFLGVPWFSPNKSQLFSDVASCCFVDQRVSQRCCQVVFVKNNGLLTSGANTGLSVRHFQVGPGSWDKEEVPGSLGSHAANIMFPNVYEHEMNIYLWIETSTHRHSYV